MKTLSGLMMWIGPVIGVTAMATAWTRVGPRRKTRAGKRRVQREAIDIDLVLEEKYPNRKAARSRRALVKVGAPARSRAVVESIPLEELEDLETSEPVPAFPAAAIPEPTPDPRKAWPEKPAPGAYYPPPVLDAEPWTPIPGEPGADTLLGPPRRPARITETPEGLRLVASPYEALRRRRDRIATQAAAAFAEVHRLRTESLRRASQAEHNAELATSARVRASRMARESRRYESQGRVRSAAVPDADDAFHDVHRFRVEALRRAHEAEHGAESVAQARERATRLLAEQRRIEAEMARLRRGVVPGENL